MKDLQDKLKNMNVPQLAGVFFAVFAGVTLFSLAGAAIFSYGNFTVYQKMVSQQSEELATLSKMKSELSNELNSLHTVQSADKLDVSQQFALLREELIKMKSQQEVRPQVLGTASLTPTPFTSPAPDVKGITQLDKKWEKADVFQEPVASSKIIGQALKGKLYFTYGTKQGWIKIELPSTQQGWIQQQLLDDL